jgi:hypothetical protein
VALRQSDKITIYEVLSILQNNPAQEGAMSRTIVAVVMMFLLFIAAPTSAEEKEKEKTKFTYGGVYTAWAQHQNAFTFDEDAYKHRYVVQMLRLKLGFAANEHVKAVTRFDIGQGWWGVDNSLRSVNRTGTGGGSALFDYKDTNFLFHVDQAYISFDIPDTPAAARVGRMWFGLGNKLMVDNNYDGIQVDLKDVLGKKITLCWAKVSEGHDNLTDNQLIAADPRGNTDARDANLFMLNFNNQSGDFAYDAFALYYEDESISDGNAFVPDHLQFFKTRFTPQISKLTAFGLSGKYKAGKVTVKGEFDYLMGKDDIANTTHGAKQQWDINNGDLSGFNIYINGAFAATDKVKVGGVFGMGSGDDDLCSGDGNINKLRTSGFFYLTEVWEDSIMPDEEGITPQGLGAPNVRGYRELENTTALQANVSVKPIEKLELFGSYTFLKATQPVPVWSVVTDTLDVVVDASIENDDTADDLGSEVDFRISYMMYKQLNVSLRGGVFLPGDAALYLIRGNNAIDDPAWELKGMITLKF